MRDYVDKERVGKSMNKDWNIDLTACNRAVNKQTHCDIQMTKEDLRKPSKDCRSGKKRASRKALSLDSVKGHCRLLHSCIPHSRTKTF